MFLPLNCNLFQLFKREFCLKHTCDSQYLNKASLPVFVKWMNIFSYTVLISEDYTLKNKRYENGETKWIKPKIAGGSNLNMNQLWISPWCNKPVIWESLKVWTFPGWNLHSSDLNSCPQQISSKLVIRNHHHIRPFSFYFIAFSALLKFNWLIKL